MHLMMSVLDEAADWIKSDRLDWVHRLSRMMTEVQSIAADRCQQIVRRLREDRTGPVLKISRSRSESAIERIVRAFHAQPKQIKMTPTMANDVLPRTSAPTTIRIGNTGIVMNVSTKTTTIRSYQPPMNPALRPKNVEIAVIPRLTPTPSSSELRIATTRNQKMSCPSAVVPSKCCRVRGRFFR